MMPAHGHRIFMPQVAIILGLVILSFWTCFPNHHGPQLGPHSHVDTAGKLRKRQADTVTVTTTLTDISGTFSCTQLPTAPPPGTEIPVPPPGNEEPPPPPGTNDPNPPPGSEDPTPPPGSIDPVPPPGTENPIPPPGTDDPAPPPGGEDPVPPPNGEDPIPPPSGENPVPPPGGEDPIPPPDGENPIPPPGGEDPVPPPGGDNPVPPPGTVDPPPPPPAIVDPPPPEADTPPPPPSPPSPPPTEPGDDDLEKFLCSPSTCSGGVCPLPGPLTLHKRGKAEAPKDVDELLNTDDITNAGDFTEPGTFATGEVSWWQQMKTLAWKFGSAHGTQGSSSHFESFGIVNDDKWDMTVVTGAGPVWGCTTILVMTDKGAYTAHFWEAPSFMNGLFPADPATFVSDTLVFLDNGGTDGPSLKSFTQSGSAFDKDKYEFIYAAIMTPSPLHAPGQVRYDTEVGLIRGKMAQLLGLKLEEINVFTYVKDDAIWDTITNQVDRTIRLTEEPWRGWMLIQRRGASTDRMPAVRVYVEKEAKTTIEWCPFEEDEDSGQQVRRQACSLPGSPDRVDGPPAGETADVPDTDEDPTEALPPPPVEEEKQEFPVPTSRLQECDSRDQCANIDCPDDCAYMCIPNWTITNSISNKPESEKGLCWCMAGARPLPEDMDELDFFCDAKPLWTKSWKSINQAFGPGMAQWKFEIEVGYLNDVDLR